MSNEIIAVSYNELTPAEQAIVAQAVGWDGKQYHDSKSGITIELVDGDVASYRVLSKGDQVEAPAAEVQATEPAPAPEVTAPEATAPATDDTNASEQNTTAPAPENGDVNASAPADDANAPAPTE